MVKHFDILRVMRLTTYIKVIEVESPVRYIYLIKVYCTTPRKILRISIKV